MTTATATTFLAKTLWCHLLSCLNFQCSFLTLSVAQHFLKSTALAICGTATVAADFSSETATKLLGTVAANSSYRSTFISETFKTSSGTLPIHLTTNQHQSRPSLLLPQGFLVSILWSSFQVLIGACANRNCVHVGRQCLIATTN
jgi:hypothetical protein